MNTFIPMGFNTQIGQVQQGYSLIPGYFLVSYPMVDSQQMGNLNDIQVEKLAEDYCLCELKNQEAEEKSEVKEKTKKINEDFTVVEDEKFKEPEKLGEKKRRCFKTEKDNDVLEPFQFKYIHVGTSRYKRKIIQCLYEGCNKTFGKSWNFRDHALMHEGHKPYKCSICGKCFTQKGNMKKHVKLHEGKDVTLRKSFKCIYCSKSYTERYNLRSHLKKVHKVTKASKEIAKALDYKYAKTPTLPVDKET
ncbi:unnamed protein product [Moneuplotes crassus]|uniref:C2H2-type domain-containing protein n=1 Tax=Euplotes crassus TaxID=5936 RepID=A0AAD1UF86_EUPCR|nr:unnamed protein product [Moneuplotes crassus]